MVAVSNLHNAPAWAALTSYIAGQRRMNDTGPVKCYQCTTAGTSGATGPTGTGSAISDGTCVWEYLSAVDYTSLTAWAAANPTAASGGIAAYLWNDLPGTPWPSATLSITSASTAQVTITAAPGESFADNPNAQTNALRFNPSNGAAIYNSTVYIGALDLTTNFGTISRMQVKSTGYRGSGINMTAPSAGALMVSQCIGQQTSGEAVLRGNPYGGSMTIINSLMVAANGQPGVILQSINSSTAIEGNTIIQPANYTLSITNGGVQQSYGASNMTCRNNAFFGFANPLVASGHAGSWLADGHNATDQASISGTSTGNVTSVPFTTATFKQPSNAGGLLDMRLVSGSALVDVGSSSVISNKDIVGTTRPQGTAYDIGAWELVQSAASAVHTLTLLGVGGLIRAVAPWVVLGKAIVRNPVSRRRKWLFPWKA